VKSSIFQTKTQGITSLSFRKCGSLNKSPESNLTSQINSKAQIQNDKTDRRKKLEVKKIQDARSMIAVANFKTKRD
jgi:hypothetical protein